MLHGLFNWLTCSHLPKKVQNMFGFLHIFLNFLAICFAAIPCEDIQRLLSKHKRNHIIAGGCEPHVQRTRSMSKRAPSRH